MCDAEAGGIKYDRIIKDLDGFSVDVVQMKDAAGPITAIPQARSA